jgi:hypothetical protein
MTPRSLMQRAKPTEQRSMRLRAWLTARYWADDVGAVEGVGLKGVVTVAGGRIRRRGA